MIAALEAAIKDEVEELHAEIREHDFHIADLRARIEALGLTYLQFAKMRNDAGE